MCAALGSRDARGQTFAAAAAADRACTSQSVLGLANQVFATLMCTHPGVLVPLDLAAHNLRVGAAPRAYLSADAANRLYAFASHGPTITLTATFWTVVDQYFLFVISTRGTGNPCTAALARAGQGRHETGVAIDVVHAAQYRAQARYGCCMPTADPVHYECRPNCTNGNGTAPSAGGDLQLRAWDVAAFQHLWNANNPGDPIAENGVADGATLSRISASPASGFAHDGCAPDHDGDGYHEGQDCNDNDPLIHPGAPERCNGVDDNCNGLIDENLTQVCGSAIGACQYGTETCTTGVWSACVGGVTATPEVCDGIDNDCNGVVDDGRICEREEAALGAAAEGGSSDIDGDGRADACARTAGGFECLLASGHGFAGTVLGPPLSDADGYSSVFRSATLRMGDLDGDGRADLCVAGPEVISCWRMGTAGFAEQVFTLPVPPGMTNLLLADVNGDGRDDVCARGTDGLQCDLSTPTGFSQQVTLPALSDASGFGDVLQYGSIRMADFNGDHRADVCVRAPEGVRCWQWETSGFGDMVVGPPWSDASGFNELPYWSTVRFADVDGDGRADLCARGTDDTFACNLSNGHGFDGARRGPMLATADGWSRTSSYTTLRLADIDADGDLDLCGRAPEGIHCWVWTGNDFTREISGPALSDADGWNGVAYFRSLRMADVTGDGRADLCARAPDGLRCYESDGSGFPRLWVTSQWGDGAGFTDLARTASLRVSGGSRSPANTGCTCSAAVGPARSRSKGSGWVGAALACLAIVRRRARRRD